MIEIDLALNADTPGSKEQVGYKPSQPNKEWNPKDPEISSSSAPYKIYNIGNN